MNYLIPLDYKRLSDGEKGCQAVMEMTAPGRILQTIIAALEEGKFSEAVKLFDNEFTFTDHALELEFVEKVRLIEFFQKTREFFPDAVVMIDAIFESGDTIVAEWTLTATQSESFWGGTTRRVPISLPGVTILQLEHERITRWADYYDKTTSRRMGLAALFQELGEY
jgi:steroid delta-isomerase-like uncharacterized protein